MVKYTPKKEIRDRVKEFRRVKASELQRHPLNWRKHPERQTRAMAAALKEIGFAGALLVYETDEGLRLIDGHLRAGLAPSTEVPVLVLDVNEIEARKILATFDPISAIAESDGDLLKASLAGIEWEQEELKKLVDMGSSVMGTDIDDLDLGDGLIPEKPDMIKIQIFLPAEKARHIKQEIRGLIEAEGGILVA